MKIAAFPQKLKTIEKAMKNKLAKEQADAKRKAMEEIALRRASNEADRIKPHPVLRAGAASLKTRHFRPAVFILP